VASIEDKMRENWLRGLGDIQWRPLSAPGLAVRRIDRVVVGGGKEA